MRLELVEIKIIPTINPQTGPLNDKWDYSWDCNITGILSHIYLFPAIKTKWRFIDRRSKSETWMASVIYLPLGFRVIKHYLGCRTLMNDIIWSNELSMMGDNLVMCLFLVNVVVCRMGLNIHYLLNNNASGVEKVRSICEVVYDFV